MSFDFKFPDVGEGLHEGTLVEWLVGVGEQVQIDQPFARVETDKAVVELPAPRAATVETLHYAPGDVIQVGRVMVTFSGESTAENTSANAPSIERGQPEDRVVGATGGDRGNGGNSGSVGSSGIRGDEAPAETARPGADDDPRRLIATPHTRTLARRLGIDLALVAATGRGGRITDEDVMRTADQAQTQEVSALSAVETPRLADVAAMAGAASAGTSRTDVRGRSDRAAEQRVPLSHLRKVIAEAMATSKRTAAHVTHIDDADVTELVAMHARVRAHLRKDGGPKLSLLTYFVKAVAAALGNHPLLNATFDAERQEIVLRRDIHLGIAVDTDEGLVVPVLRDPDRKDLLTVAADIEDLAARARSRQLRVDELRGGTFTVSSLGPIGGAFATPIIHQPEMAIVGLHAIKDRPAVVDGQVVPRKVMFVSLSYDHRFVDGAVAARFMAELMELVQRPDLLMLRL